jgi:hypothetical protein
VSERRGAIWKGDEERASDEYRRLNEESASILPSVSQPIVDDETEDESQQARCGEVHLDSPKRY